MLTIGIIDDEIRWATELSSLVDQYIKEYNIKAEVSIYNSVESLMKDIDNLSFIFLDIELSGDNGINVANDIMSIYKNKPIVFVSNYDKYLFKAFGAHAFDYLVKPVNYKQFEKVLNDLFQIKYKLLEKEISHSFKTQRGIIEYNVPEIYYFELDFRKIYMAIGNKRIRIVDKFKSIKHLFLQYDFYSPHKSYMINLAHVKDFKGYEITMDNGDLIPLSQKKSAEFRKIFNRYQNDNPL